MMDNGDFDNDCDGKGNESGDGDDEGVAVVEMCDGCKALDLIRSKAANRSGRPSSDENAFDRAIMTVE